MNGDIRHPKRVAHEFGPGLLFERDQTLEFAQYMGVAGGVIDRVEPAIRQEMVARDDAPFKSCGIAPRFPPAR